MLVSCRQRARTRSTLPLRIGPIFAIAVLLPERDPSKLAGNAFIVVDSSERR